MYCRSYRYEMRVVKATNIDCMKHVALEWKETCNANNLGVTMNPDVYFEKLAKLIDRDDAALFLLFNLENKVVGYMGVESFYSPLDNQKIANEHHWYMLESYRGGIGAMRLVNAIKEWAKEHGCSHLIMNASNLASDLHDSVCKFYESIGMKKFETSYIQEII